MYICMYVCIYLPLWARSVVGEVIWPRMFEQLMFDESGKDLEVVVTYFTVLSRNFSRGNFSQGIRCFGRISIVVVSEYKSKA